MKVSAPVLALVLGLASGAALACRPVHWSPAAIIQQSSVVFIAKIVRKLPSDGGPEMVELAVKEVLKGWLPKRLITDRRNIRAFGDGCNVIHGVLPVRNIGEEWVISGNFNAADHSFQPVGDTSFLVGGGGQAAEPAMNEFLRSLRRELSR